MYSSGHIRKRDCEVVCGKDCSDCRTLRAVFSVAGPLSSRSRGWSACHCAPLTDVGVTSAVDFSMLMTCIVDFVLQLPNEIGF